MNPIFGTSQTKIPLSPNGMKTLRGVIGDVLTADGWEILRPSYLDYPHLAAYRSKYGPPSEWRYRYLESNRRITRKGVKSKRILRLSISARHLGALKNIEASVGITL